MPRSGSLSEWERRLAAQTGMTNGWPGNAGSRIRKRQGPPAGAPGVPAADRGRADRRGRQEQIESLDEVLTSVLALPPMSFDRLMSTPRTPEFDPGPLAAWPGPTRTGATSRRPGRAG